jgi:hypothetical protein
MSLDLKKLVGVALAALTAIAVVAPVAQATTPAAGYSQFAGCPSPSENPAVEGCIRSVVTGGHMKLGSKDVPIANPLVLSGGVDGSLGNFAFNSKGGLPPVKETVPGGVVGLTGLTWLFEVLGSKALTLYAAPELAGTPQFEGFARINLPLKVHLINPILGNNCYVGSSTSPVMLHLNVTNEATQTFDEALQILHLNNTVYVDNTFSAPGASGCVLTLLGFIPINIDGLVNSQSGLPAPTGNEASQIINTELTASSNVYP